MRGAEGNVDEAGAQGPALDPHKVRIRSARLTAMGHGLSPHVRRSSKVVAQAGATKSATEQQGPSRAPAGGSARASWPSSITSAGGEWEPPRSRPHHVRCSLARSPTHPPTHASSLLTAQIGGCHTPTPAPAPPTPQRRHLRVQRPRVCGLASRARAPARTCQESLSPLPSASA
jgi:hypothetical protein